MTILKLKSIIYRYLGIFLADREELEYVDSEIYWKQFMKIIKKKSNDMSPRDIHGLLIGSWQAHHGFARPIGPIRLHMFKYKYKTIRPLVQLVENICILFIQLRWDALVAYRYVKHYLGSKR
jgi:hypothetical protein